MEVKTTCHCAAATHRKLERTFSSSVNIVRDSIRNPQNLRQTSSDSALNPQYFSLEKSVEPPPPTNGMCSSLPAGNKISHTQEFFGRADIETLRREMKRNFGLRENLYGRRLQLREKRHELQEERSLQTTLDAKFIQSVREILQQSNEKMEEIYTQLDSQRDVVGELEYDYDQAEDEHDTAENQLDHEEEKLRRLLQKLLPENSDDDGDDSLSPLLNGDLQPDRFPDPITYDEGQLRRMEYQSRIGDAQIMHERLQDLISERNRRLSFSRKRENYYVDHDGSDDNFTEQLDATAEELGIINADVQRLREALQQDGFIDLNTIEKSEPDPALSGILDPSGPQLTASEKARPLSDSIMPKLQKNFGIARARISQWLLVTFGNSPVEQVRHKEMLRDLGDGVSDDKQWARLVFKFWKKDEENGSIGSWNEIGQQDLAEQDESSRPPRIQHSILLSSKSKAEDAVNEYEHRFPFSNGAPNDRATPYNSDVLELDTLSEYESRSF